MAIKQIPWHFLGLKEVKDKLLTDFDKGLEEKEISKRQRHHGRNFFEKKNRFYYLKLFWRQIKNPLVFILIISGVVTFILREYANTIVIFIAVFINTAIGMIQEGKASKSFEKLRSSQKKYATVIRNNRQKIIESIELVPGDIIVLQMGDQVPADARLISVKGLEINESTLTGEWLSVEKDEKEKIKENVPINEMSNMVWMGTLVTEGWGKAVIIGTGLSTEIGKIAEAIDKDDEVVTPLQKGVKHLVRFLSMAIILVLAVIFILGLLRGEPLVEMLLISVALAVSAIPEGLPAAVTVVLAIGMERILRQGGLIKNLNAAETLGSATVILTDKTGTLTKSEMKISKIMTFLSEDKKSREKEHKDRLELLQMALLSSNAFIENPDEGLKEWKIRGGPMDKAILTASIEGGLNPVDLDKKHLKIDFIPFDSERRFSSSLYKSFGQKSPRAYMIGAPELILSFCNKIYVDGKASELDDKKIKLMKTAYEKETGEGTRMVGVAYKDGDWVSFPHRKEEQDEIFKNMVFGGFIGFHDPIREDVAESINVAREGSIRTIMATGDHIITAKRVAREIGLFAENGLVMSGEEIDKMDDKTLESIVEKVDVFARVLPHHKMRIVKALQSKGEIVAMTGDGVNDASALKNADIGVALNSGTEVAKEASDLVLLDNNFNVIVYAIKEGRRILDNLRKIIAYLFSTSFSEIVLIGSAVLFGLPLPVLPAQILWVNIIEEGLMNFAFAFEPKEEDLMKRNPKNESSKKILTPQLRKMIFIITITASAFLIALYFLLHYFNYPIEKIRTVMYAALAIDSIFFSFSLKNLKKPIWKINLISNKYLIFSLLTGLGLLLVSLFTPVFQKLLSLTAITPKEVSFLLVLGLLNLAAIEIIKYFLFEKNVLK